MYYVITLAVYGAVDAIACLGLSQQFGVGGVTNFGFIIFQSAGAYAAAILALPPDTANGGFQTYIGGLDLPFPLPWLGAARPAACSPCRSPSWWAAGYAATSPLSACWSPPCWRTCW